MSFLRKPSKEDLRCFVEKLGEQSIPDARTVDLKEMIILSKNYEAEFLRRLAETHLETRHRKKKLALEMEERKIELERLRMEKTNEMIETMNVVEMIFYSYEIEFIKRIRNSKPRKMSLLCICPFSNAKQGRFV